MSDALTHRGPDDGGVWVDPVAGLMLGHRRLSILDVSTLGHQPMESADSRLILVFNGEIYNHLHLRRRLTEKSYAPRWRGHSDTETLLACFAAWGVDETLKSAQGMFALALWDKAASRLTLARDRLGEKPLYYGWQGDTFLFGSELKALQAHPRFRAEVDRDALTLLLRHNYIPAPYSIFTGIAKLEPGHFLTVDLSTGVAGSKSTPVAYWRLNDVATAGIADPIDGSPADAIDMVEAALTASVTSQMMSDVPLGAFLSGGVDSSAVVALMQSNSSRPVRTFTIGSETPNYDEAPYAKAVATYLGTDHTELVVRAEDALEVIPQLPSAYCEPFGDSSQIPTFLVSKLASEHVKVALSGDGGDEVFGGYNRYLRAQQAWKRIGGLPGPFRRSIAKMLTARSPQSWDNLYSAVATVLPKRMRVVTPGDKAHKLAKVVEASNGRDYYRRLTSHWDDPGSLVIDGSEPPTHITSTESWLTADSLELQMMAMDGMTYLPDDILVKVDRAAMANSLETRAPMIDPRVVESAWRLPIDLKIRGGVGKWVLREMLYRHVPKPLIERPKMGFGIPLDEWLRGPLRDWAESLIDEARLRRDGYFHPTPIRAMWVEHLSRRRNWQHHLWTILTFQAWLDELALKGTTQPTPPMLAVRDPNTD